MREITFQGTREMVNRIMFFSTVFVLVSSMASNSVLAQTYSTILGHVKDAQTGDPLPSANVMIVATGLGAPTDMNGKYIIRNVPSGSYVLRASYLGYESVEVSLEVTEEENITKEFMLVPVALEGEIVVVTGQAAGQKEAINKQLAAPQIMNVVSSARIQELPDANAAESVGRLPGVSVLRNSGEGTQVVIRGLQPKYNAIMVNGVRMSSSDPSDRSADLSMISPHMLEAIEVTKAVTPDQDADVLGGTVNFKLREAGEGKEGMSLNLVAQAGYNGLPNAPNKYNNYKYVASVEGRFFDDKFGVFAQMDLERKNLTSNDMGASYIHEGRSLVNYLPLSLNLNHTPRERQRVNGLAVLDYKLSAGKISLSNFVSSGVTEIENRGESFDIPTNVHYYSLEHRSSTLSKITNSFDVEQEFPIFRTNIKLSHAYSETKNPNDWQVRFSQASAGLSQFLGAANVHPQAIQRASNNDTNSTYLNSLVSNSSFSRERALTASLDLETDINVSDMVTTVLKFGGKYRYQTRSYLYDQFTGQGLGLVSARTVDSLIASHFPSTSAYVNTTSIPIVPFLDPSFDYGKFLNGEYRMVLPLNFAMISDMANFVRRKADFLAERGDVAYFHDNFNSTTRDYTGNENQNAFYVMTTVNIGSEVTIIGGVRYQNLQTTYTAARGLQNTASALGGAYFHYDTTLTVNHPYWLPDVIVRYKPLPWFDVRLSHTNTIAYPDYGAIIPRIDVAIGGNIAWNNYGLIPSRSKNYDAYCSFYDNAIGLFTVGGFLKRIDNLIYPWTFNVSGVAALQYYPPSLASGTPTGTFEVSTFVNNPYRIDNWGLEIDWQTHFWYFPRPFDGLVLNVNYTHIFSRAEYPYTDTRRVGRVIEYVDTSYIDRLLHQPNNIVNLSVGYDHEGFSMRLSMLLQAEIYSGTDYWPQTRSSTAPYTRWDFSVKQDFPWLGLQVYGDLNNINGVSDINVIKAPTGVPRSQQSYGLTADLGLRLSF